MVIAVVGDSEVVPGDPRDRFAEELGRRVVDRGWRLQTGGRGGVMEAASRGARSSTAWRDGLVIGLLPGEDRSEANAYVDVAVPTGLGHARNLLVARADAVVGVGGGAGTLMELAAAWLYRRLVVAKRGEGWSGRLADQRLDDKIRFADLPDDRIYGVDTPEECVDLLVRLLPRYSAS
jgi:hypothetical protein